MANVLHSFKFLPTIASKFALKAPCNAHQSIRTLYSQQTLGLDAYTQQRTRTNSQLGNISEKFRSKMEEYTSSESKNMIFTEDLKNMIHLATAADIPLVIRMMNKFNEQNKQLRFGNFVFGPVVMRMFHFLNQPQDALESFNSPLLEGFFDQLMTYQLLMDLLFENQMYKEMLQVFEKIQSRQLADAKYPRNIIVLTLAACYKLNSQDSFKYATNLWGDLKDVGHMPMRRAITFCSALALQQNSPEVALEIVSTARNQNYATVRNLKALSLARLGRIDEAMQILKSILEQENVVKQTFNKEVVDEIKGSIEKAGNTELMTEMTRIEKYFSEQEHFAKNSLEEQLCEEIKTPPFLGKFRTGPGNRNPMFDRRFNTSQRDSFQGRQFQPRPGLVDMQ